MDASLRARLGQAIDGPRTIAVPWADFCELLTHCHNTEARLDRALAEVEALKKARREGLSDD